MHAKEQKKVQSVLRCVTAGTLELPLVQLCSVQTVVSIFPGSYAYA